MRWPILAVLLTGCDLATVHLVERESCTNHVDDDRDGKTDCADPDCFGVPLCCVDECEPGIALCDPSTGSGQAPGFRACEVNAATGCTVVGAATACGTGAQCSGGVCGATCVDLCTEGEQQCIGSGASAKCARLAGGCTDWVVLETCVSGLLCSSGECRPVAACMTTCTQGSTRCNASGQQQTCVSLGNGCFDWGFPQSSPACMSGGAGGGSAAGGGSGAMGGGSGAMGGGSATSQSTYVKPSDTTAYAKFGTEVALSADGTTLAVPSMGQGSGTGAVYIFRKTGGVWAQEQLLKANAPAVEGFAVAVAISGDGNAVIVGAYQSGGTGAAYVFRKTGPHWAQEQKLTVSTAAMDDEIGQGVALSGDGNLAALGAPSDSTGASKSGAVYVFRRAGSWSQEAVIRAAHPQADAKFGNALALSADGSTLAITAWGESSSAPGVNGNEADTSMTYAGAAWIYKHGTSWTQQAYLKSSSPAAFATFGVSVALSADGTAVAIGATGDASDATGIDGPMNANADSAGAAYVFRASGGAWAQEAYVKASNTGTYDAFGMRVGLSADGLSLVVTAVYESSAADGLDGDQADDSADFAGAAYFFHKGAQWSQQHYLKATNSATGDFFGQGASISGDGHTVAFGAYCEDSAATGMNGDQSSNGATNSGAAYVYSF